MLGVTLFVGWTIAAVIVPRIADLYGRKITFIVNMIVQFIAMIFIVFAKSYNFMAFSLFLIGITSAGRWTVSYIYLCEFWTELNIKRFGPFVNASAAVCVFFSAFTLQFLTSNTAILTYIGLVMTLVSIVLSYLMLPESPKWLIG